MKFKIKKLALIWWDNKYINPGTKKKLCKFDLIFKFFLKVCLINNLINDCYHNYHNVLLDPILKLELPLQEEKKLFKYKYIWDPYNGNRLGIDPRGPLYFDPCSLVYYFYKNRLKKLYKFPDSDFEGYYDDAVGIGKDFFRKDIGYNIHWYLFRLPLQFANYNKNLQQTTVGPKLSYYEIQNIYELALTYNNFEERFNMKMPNLLYIYQVYHQAIEKLYNIDYNILAVQTLINMEEDDF